MAEPAKTCTKCEKTKPLSEFHRQREGKDGRRSVCKLCYSAYGREYRDAHKEQRAGLHLQRTFGITLDNYDEMLEDQGNSCASAAELLKRMVSD